LVGYPAAIFMGAVEVQSSQLFHTVAFDYFNNSVATEYSGNSEPYRLTCKANFRTYSTSGDFAIMQHNHPLYAVDSPDHVTYLSGSNIREWIHHQLAS
jgi:hypothetical protein